MWSKGCERKNPSQWQHCFPNKRSSLSLVIPYDIVEHVMFIPLIPLCIAHSFFKFSSSSTLFVVSLLSFAPCRFRHRPSLHLSVLVFCTFKTSSIHSLIVSRQPNYSREESHASSEASCELGYFAQTSFASSEGRISRPPELR